MQIRISKPGVLALLADFRNVVIQIILTCIIFWFYLDCNDVKRIKNESLNGIPVFEF